MLDYAANATRVWTGGLLRERFEVEAGDEVAGRELLAVRLGIEDEPDDEADAYETFWERVDVNLRADRIRLLFVADRIPDELAHVVEFLNRHMAQIEVLAVEVKAFRGEGVRALVPRVIGRSAASPAGRTPPTRMTLDRLVDEFPEGAVRTAARLLIERARLGPRSRRDRAAPASAAAAGSGASLSRWPGSSPPRSAGCAPGTSCSVRASSRDMILLPRLRYWRRCSDTPSSSSMTRTRTTRRGVAAWYVEPRDAAQHIEVLAGRVEAVLRELAEL